MRGFCSILAETIPPAIVGHAKRASTPQRPPAKRAIADGVHRAGAGSHCSRHSTRGSGNLEGHEEGAGVLGDEGERELRLLEQLLARAAILGRRLIGHSEI